MKKVFLCFLMLTFPALGQNFGLGTNSCAQFAKDYAATTETAENFYFTWAQGFMSALNLNAITENRPYRDVGAIGMTEQKSAIRSYCNLHPLASFVEAVFSEYENLPLKGRPN